MGTQAYAVKAAKGNPNNSTQGQGDLPLIIGSWIGTLDPVTNQWTFKVNDAQVSQIKNDMGKKYQQRKPTLGEIDKWVGYAKDAVEETGCTLKVRNGGYSNSGYDIYK